MQIDSDDDLFSRVAQAVEQTIYIEANALTPKHRLVDDLRIGKFGRIRLALYLEETFDIEIPDDAVNRFATVGDIVHYMNRWTLGSGDGAGHARA